VYRSKPFIVARLLCCLFVDLIWRNLLYIPVERGDLIQSLPRRVVPALVTKHSGEFFHLAPKPIREKTSAVGVPFIEVVEANPICFWGRPRTLIPRTYRLMI